MEVLHHPQTSNTANMHQSAGIEMKTVLASAQIIKNAQECLLLAAVSKELRRGYIH